MMNLLCILPINSHIRLTTLHMLPRRYRTMYLSICLYNNMPIRICMDDFDLKIKTHCQLCNCDDIELIHKKTRDNPNVNVLRCKNCGLVFLDSTPADNYYEDSMMNCGEKNIEKYRELTENDDLRRVNMLKDIVCNKSVLDFGCGNGGFLRNLGETVRKGAGVELDNYCRETLISEGITCKKYIDEYSEKFGVITMFHVIEHLSDPISILHNLKNYLSEEGGKLIIETPNADDALLSRYNCSKFADFTYWSPHVYLYNSNTLASLLDKSGFKLIFNEQIQRYPLSNHMKWIFEGSPGGHNDLKYDSFNAENINNAYVRLLSLNKVCDTLYACAEVKE